MQAFGSKKEKYHLHNYLTLLVKAIENKCTIVDLRNESCVVGLVKHVDGLMNIEMESVTFYDPQGGVYYFNEFYVSKRNIRYVHIPEGLSATEAMKNQLNEFHHKKVREPKKESFKTLRAKRYNAEILQSMYQSQQGPSKME